MSKQFCLKNLINNVCHSNSKSSYCHSYFAKIMLYLHAMKVAMKKDTPAETWEASMEKYTLVVEEV